MARHYQQPLQHFDAVSINPIVAVDPLQVDHII
jgi:hypothetical protein